MLHKEQSAMKTQYGPIMSNIYENGVWNNRRATVPLSGPGSSIESTSGVRDFLDNKMQALFGIQSVLDIGCGDLTWLANTTASKGAFSYTGIDVVEQLIDKHKETFEWGSFFCCDVCRQLPPPITRTADLILLRDMIMHLTVDDVIDLFAKLVTFYDFQFMLITSHCTGKDVEENLNPCHYHAIDLSQQPFYFDLSLACFEIDEPEFKRKMYLFDRNALKTCVRRINTSTGLTDIMTDSFPAPANQIQCTEILGQPFVINLASRPDRLEHFRVTMKANGINPDFIERFDAVATPGRGWLGCVRSHIAILKLAIERDLPRITIFEDDFMWCEDARPIEPKLLQLHKLEFDVFMLGTRITRKETGPSEGIVRIVQAYTSSGYVVNRHYFETLLACFEESERLLDQHVFNLKQVYSRGFALDVKWHALQERDNWLAHEPVMGKQRDGYSDIVNRVFTHDYR